MRRMLSALATFVLLSAAARAEEPRPVLVNHHGYLLAGDDTPIDADVAIGVKLWRSEVESDASLLAWADAWPAVRVRNGRYAIVLGGGDQPLDAAIFEADLWLGISVGDVELYPRLKLSPVPAAAMASVAKTARDAQRLGGREPAYYLDAANLTGTLAAERLPLATDAASGAITAAQKKALDALAAAPSCAAREKLVYDGARWTCADESDPGVQAFAKAALPSCPEGSALRAGANGLECANPKVGALTGGRWCRTDGTVVVCDQPAPTLVETDPKIGAQSANRLCSSNGALVTCPGKAPSLDADGHVGIVGTLSVAGGVKVGDLGTCDAAATGTMRWSTTTTRLQVCDGSQWLTVQAFDATPDEFAFANRTDQLPNALVTATPVTIQGFQGSIAVSVTGEGNPEVQIAGGAWVTNGIVTPGQSLNVRLTSGPQNTVRTATITVGDTKIVWTVGSGAFGLFTWVSPSGGSAGQTMGTIPGVAGKRIRITRIGICGDSDPGSGPNQFRATDGAASLTWEAGQSVYGSDFRLSATPTSGSSRGFSYASVDRLMASGASVTLTWSYHLDWDGLSCQATDEFGNSYSDAGSTVRAWVVYRYE